MTPTPQYARLPGGVAAAAQTDALQPAGPLRRVSWFVALCEGSRRCGLCVSAPHAARPRDASGCAQSFVQLRESRAVMGCRKLDCDLKRPVEALAETMGNEVIRLARRVTRRVVTGVGYTQDAAGSVTQVSDATGP